MDSTKDNAKTKYKTQNKTTDQIFAVSLSAIANHLSINDIVEFATLPQQILSEKKFFVIAVNSIQFENAWNHLFTIANDRTVFHMSFDANYGRVLISQTISLEIAHKIIFSTGTTFDEVYWHDASYNGESTKMEGIQYEKDFRKQLINNIEFTPREPGKKFDHESFVGKTGKFIIDIEIFEDTIKQYSTIVMDAHEAIANVACWKKQDDNAHGSN